MDIGHLKFDEKQRIIRKFKKSVEDVNFWYEENPARQKKDADIEWKWMDDGWIIDTR